MTLSMGTPEIHNFVFRYHTLNTIDTLHCNGSNGRSKNSVRSKPDNCHFWHTTIHFRCVKCIIRDKTCLTTKQRKSILGTKIHIGVFFWLRWRIWCFGWRILLIEMAYLVFWLAYSFDWDGIFVALIGVLVVFVWHIYLLGWHGMACSERSISSSASGASDKSQLWAYLI